MYDDEIPLRYYTLDFIHLTREGHAMIAAALLPRVMPLIEGRRKDAAPTASATSTKSRTQLMFPASLSRVARTEGRDRRPTRGRSAACCRGLSSPAARTAGPRLQRHRPDALARRTPADIVADDRRQTVRTAGRGSGRPGLHGSRSRLEIGVPSSPMSLLVLVPAALCLGLCLIPAWLSRGAIYARVQDYFIASEHTPPAVIHNSSVACSLWLAALGPFFGWGATGNFWGFTRGRRLLPARPVLNVLRPRSNARVYRGRAHS